MDSEALRPQSPSISFDEIAEDPQVDPSDAKINALYGDHVELIFEENFKALSLPINPDLPADEYKIEGLANQKALAVLNQAWERIRNARTAVANSKGGK